MNLVHAAQTINKTFAGGKTAITICAADIDIALVFTLDYLGKRHVAYYAIPPEMVSTMPVAKREVKLAKTVQEFITMVRNEEATDVPTIAQ